MDKPYEYEVDGTYFYPDEAHGAFYTAKGDVVGALYIPMLRDGTPDLDEDGIPNVLEIEVTYEEA